MSSMCHNPSAHSCPRTALPGAQRMPRCSGVRNLPVVTAKLRRRAKTNPVTREGHCSVAIGPEHCICACAELTGRVGSSKQVPHLHPMAVGELGCRQPFTVLSRSVSGQPSYRGAVLCANGARRLCTFNLSDTLNGGSLGSHFDEDRSQLRYLMRIAGHLDHRSVERTLRPRVSLVAMSV